MRCASTPLPASFRISPAVSAGQADAAASLVPVDNRSSSSSSRPVPMTTGYGGSTYLHGHRCADIGLYASLGLRPAAATGLWRTTAQVAAVVSTRMVATRRYSGARDQRARYFRRGQAGQQWAHGVAAGAAPPSRRRDLR